MKKIAIIGSSGGNLYNLGGAEPEKLLQEIYQQCELLAYEQGMARIQPGPNHMYTYISAIFLCDSCDPEARKALKRCHRYQSFRLSYWGWMDFHTALVVLPVIWLILRAMPPAPKLVRFPGTRLLAGLRDAHPVARHTPWWLLLLRVLAIAALILAFAGPVWKPVAEPQGQGPLLIVMDAGWAAAPDWPQRQTRALRALDRASGAGQAAALLVADGREDGALPLQPASEVAARLRALVPAPWETRYPGKLDEPLPGCRKPG